MKASRPTSVRWRICLLTVVGSFVLYLLRSNMSVAGAPLSVELGLSQVQLGFVLGAFAWGYALFQFPGGVLADRVGGRRTVTLLALAWGALTLAVGLLPTAASPAFLLGALVVLRFLMGAAQAPFFPVAGGGAICNWFPASAWATAGSLQNAGLTFGSAATGPAIAWLMEQYGWRQSFVLSAPTALAVAAAWWWYYRDVPAEHKYVNAAERELIDAGRPPASPRAEPGAWREVLANRQVRILTVGYFCSNYVFYFFFNWLFIYLIDNRGFKALEGGFYAAAPWITGACGALLGGWWCDRMWKRRGARTACRMVGVVGLALTGVLLIAAARAPQPLVAVLLLSLCLGAQQLTDPVYWAATISVAGRRASTACGVLNTGGNVVGGIGAVLVPLTVGGAGWPVALASTALFAFAAAALWLFIQADAIPEVHPLMPAPAVAV